MNKKKFFKVAGITILSIVAVCVITVAIVYPSNWRNVKTLGDIPTPLGYTRVEAPAGSLGAFIRTLPLKERGSVVKLYTGETVGGLLSRIYSPGVVDFPILSNYEQCADITMRVRAEWLFSRGRYSEISFRDINGGRQTYAGGASHKALEKYLRRIYGICSTFSVTRETKPRKIEDIKPGDVFVYLARKKGAMGHAILAADVARRGDKVAVLCIQGSTPARDCHIVRNVNRPFSGEWHIFDADDETFQIGTHYFGVNELRHY